MTMKIKSSTYRILSIDNLEKLPIQNLLRLMKKVRRCKINFDNLWDYPDDNPHDEYFNLIKSVANTKPHRI